MAASNWAGVSGAASDGLFGFDESGLPKARVQVAEDVEVRAAIEGSAVGAEPPVVEALRPAVRGERRRVRLGAAGDAVGAVEPVSAVGTVEGGSCLQLVGGAEA